MLLQGGLGAGHGLGWVLVAPLSGPHVHVLHENVSSDLHRRCGKLRGEGGSRGG